MINDFEDFCTWMYVIIDEIWQQIAPLFKRPGPKPVCSDSELLTLAIVGECRSWDVETEMLSYWQEHRDMFPNIPSQSRFNRRRRNLMLAFNLMRRSVLQMLDLAQERQSVIDSLPIPVVQFYLVPGSTGDWKAHGATYGKVSSKNETIFGYKLHLLITVGGLILDFELAPANATDLEVGFEMLGEHTDLEVLGDKGYISAKQAAQLWRQNRLRLQTIRAAIRKSSCRLTGRRFTMPSARSLKPSMGNWRSSSTLSKIMPIPFGVCALGFIPSSLLIPSVFTSIVYWVIQTSCKSRLWLSLSSIRP